MRYIKTYEDKLEKIQHIRKGNLVIYARDPETLYKVSKVIEQPTQIKKGHIFFNLISFYHDEFGYRKKHDWVSSIRLATPSEINDFRLKNDAKRYNL